MPDRGKSKGLNLPLYRHSTSMNLYNLTLTDAAFAQITDVVRRRATVTTCELIAATVKSARLKAVKAFKNQAWLQPKLAVCIAEVRNAQFPLIISANYP